MEAEFDIIYGQGINWEGDLIAVGLAKEIIQKKGAWLQFEGEMIGQGKEASRKALQDEPALAQKILAKIKGETVEEPPQRRNRRRNRRVTAAEPLEVTAWPSGPA